MRTPDAHRCVYAVMARLHVAFGLGSRPSIDGALLDNIVDYLNWTFVPLVLLWYSGGCLSLMAFLRLGLFSSVFAFINTGAKTELGFFRSSVLLERLCILHRPAAPILWTRFGADSHAIATACLVFLALLSVLPVYFVYHRIDQYRAFFIGGGIVWVLQCVAMLIWYPDIPSGCSGAVSFMHWAI